MAFSSRLGVGMANMSSTLVETVSINYEDFNESFLTCRICLCTYDGGDHTPKLLPCSHTVCLYCLNQMASEISISIFDCPLCREVIKIPQSGVSALPPSLVVNQLLDLMKQKREVIRQCSSHPGRELLFCETCDCVFCRHCADGPHSDPPCHHTAVPFSIALKRMSEILLSKANECLSKLGYAKEAVASELRRLEAAATAADEAIDRHFTELKAMLDKRHNEIKSAAADAATHKRTMLEKQLELIDAEEEIVQEERSCIQKQVEVKEVSSRIKALETRLKVAVDLVEPRENALLVVDFAYNDVHQRFAEILTEIGRVRTSTTFPGLCTLRLESFEPYSNMVVVLHTVDFHDKARSTGGDPVTAAATLDDMPLSCTVTDHDNGLYRISLTPWSSGTVSVRVLVFSRCVRGSPLSINVAPPAFVFGNLQPIARTPVVVKQIYEYVKPGGRVFFRDYRRHDLAQLSFEEGSCISDNFYARGDNSMVYFFTQEEISNLFKGAGFVEEQNCIDRKYLLFTKNKLKIQIQAKYCKPLIM